MRLIIDGNAFINVAISVTKNVTSRDQRVGDTYYVNDLFSDSGFILKEAVRVSFRNFCFTYLNSLIVPLGSSLSSVHIVFDSKSWRKEYISTFFKEVETKSHSLSEFTYKGTRKYEDMHYLFFDYFQKILVPAWQESSGVNCHKVEASEGDDIIAGLCERSDEDSVIYSVDQDLKQLVTGNGKNVVLLLPKQMHKFKRLISPLNLFKPEPASESLLDDFFSLDSFDSISQMERTIRALKEKDYVEQNVDSIDEILTKVLLGDKSDNVPKISGLTPSKASKVISAIRSEFEYPLAMLDALDDTFIYFCVSQISIVTKTKDQSSLDHIKQHLIFNIRILRLSTNVFPEKIKEALGNHLDSYEVTKFNPKGFYDLKNKQTSL